MTEPDFQRMSAEEYLRTEEASPYKREYVDGFVYPLHAQAGASKPHTRIRTNITAHLYDAAMKLSCRLYSSDMKLRLGGSRSFFYPDVLVACGPDNPEDNFETEPCLLVEVLSPSTAAHDRTGKFNLYTALPSLQTYLLVEQAERRVYAYSRQGEEWVLEDFRGQGEIDLPCLGRALSLGEIYVGVLA